MQILDGLDTQGNEYFSDEGDDEEYGEEEGHKELGDDEEYGEEGDDEAPESDFDDDEYDDEEDSAPLGKRGPAPPAKGAEQGTKRNKWYYYYVCTHSN